MKVLNICKDDWANFSHDNANSLRSVGVDCLDYKLNHHISRYESESIVDSEAEIVRQIKLADVVQVFHSDRSFLHHCKKRVIAYHTGTVYRQSPEVYNTAFKDVEKNVMALGELIGKGALNETYIVGAVDVRKHKFKMFTNKPVTFAHYPSNPEVKGTDKILSMFNSEGSKLVYSCERVSAEEQYKRMQACDVYIELFSPEQHGKVYGSWGITALEAAAMGKVVVTMNLSKDVYKKHYGNCPFILVETEEEFKAEIEALSKMAHKEILLLKYKTRQWVEQKHSYKATGEYILKNIL